MDCFQIAETGFGIHIQEKQLSLGKYLQNFRILEDRYARMQNKINIYAEQKRSDVPECALNLGGKSVWEERGKNCLAAPYGHCRYAAVFSPADWRGDRIIVRIDPDLYCEYSFNLNQLLSITGLHSPLLARGALTIHASYIETVSEAKSRAILFIGPSGIGKSTQADLWHRFANARIINGDRAVVKRGRKGWEAHGIPVCGSSQICENVSLPISIIVLLAQSEENRAEDIKDVEKYRALLLASAFYQWDVYESERVHKLVTELISEVPIIRLSCRPDENAVFELQRYMDQQGITWEEIRRSKEETEA